jgi:1-acyl-sn-glycerol-3-phosphate acyltransferase
VKDIRRSLLWWGLNALGRCVGALGRVLYDLEIHGEEHLPPAGPLVIVGRRVSRVDFFASVTLSAMKQVSGMTGALAICNSRLLARVGREMGVLPTLKGQSLSAAPLLEACKLLSQGKILIMPDEGEVPWDGRLQPLRAGAAWLALRVHAPILGVVMLGGYDIWPRWAARPRLSGKLRLIIGKPFYLSDAPCDRVTRGMLEQANQRLTAELELLSDGYMLRKGHQT